MTAAATHRVVLLVVMSAFAIVIGAGSFVDARAAPPGMESVARDALLDALAPALAARGATATVTVAPLDPRRPPAPCPQTTAFMPPGSRLAGRTVVGVRCTDGSAWQTFLAAEIRVEAPIWQATRALRAGDPIASGDVTQANALLTVADLDTAFALIRSTGTGDKGHAASRGLASLDGRAAAPIGRIVLRPVAMGRALTTADIRDEGRVGPGDLVRVVYRGDGFAVSSEGHSVGAADPGAPLLIRLAGGALVNGTLRADRVVELPH